MGRAIEKIALQRGHEVVLKTNSKKSSRHCHDFSAVEVAIDFSTPDTAYNNSSALTQGIGSFWNNSMARKDKLKRNN